MEAVVKVFTTLAATRPGSSGAAAVDPSPAVSGVVRVSNTFPVDAVGAAAFSHAAISRQFPAFKGRVEGLQGRLRALLRQLLSQVESAAAADAMLEEAFGADGEGDCSDLFDALDRLRETAESYVDEAQGRHSSQQVAVIQGQLAAAAAAASASAAPGTSGAAAAAGFPQRPKSRMPHINRSIAQKPQEAFDDWPIDNARDTPFVQKLREKYHALLETVSAGGSIVVGGGGKKKAGGSAAAAGLSFSGFAAVPYASAAASSSSSGGHPYKREIEAAGVTRWQVERCTAAQEFPSLEAVPCALVSTPEQLAALCDYLEGRHCGPLGEREGVAAGGSDDSEEEAAEGAGAASDDDDAMAGGGKPAGAAAGSSASARSSGGLVLPATGERTPGTSAAAPTYSYTDGPLRHPWDALSRTAPVREIAIDLEAHNARSFQGFTCLMQLSTRERDYLVDTLALRSHLHVLNRVFAHPGVVKVLHGCDSDVVWLQRDFGLFLVNVFDTGQAARILAYPSFSLAYLLHKFASVAANKEYQTADWRERPIPRQMQKYAREDTHYLLGIYDRLKNELIDASASTVEVPVSACDPSEAVRAAYAASSSSSSGAASGSNSSSTMPVPMLLASVLDRSREKALASYDKERFSWRTCRRLMVRLGVLKPTGSGSGSGTGGEGEDAAGDDAEAGAGAGGGGGDGEGDDAGFASPASGAMPVFPTPSARVFAALYDWRDAAAREHDESPGFVLPNRLLLRLCETMPVNTDALQRCCNPLPLLVRSDAEHIVRLIIDAVKGPSEGSGSAAAGGSMSSGSSSVAGVKRPAPSAVSAAAAAAGVASKRARLLTTTGTAASATDIGGGDAAPHEMMLLDAATSAATCAASGDAVAPLPVAGGAWLAPPVLSAPRATVIASGGGATAPTTTTAAAAGAKSSKRPSSSSSKLTLASFRALAVASTSAASTDVLQAASRCSQTAAVVRGGVAPALSWLSDDATTIGTGSTASSPCTSDSELDEGMAGAKPPRRAQHQQQPAGVSAAAAAAVVAAMRGLSWYTFTGLADHIELPVAVPVPAPAPAAASKAAAPASATDAEAAAPANAAAAGAKPSSSVAAAGAGSAPAPQVKPQQQQKTSAPGIQSLRERYAPTATGTGTGSGPSATAASVDDEEEEADDAPAAAAAGAAAAAPASGSGARQSAREALAASIRPFDYAAASASGAGGGKVRSGLNAAAKAASAAADAVVNNRRVGAGGRGDGAGGKPKHNPYLKKR